MIFIYISQVLIKNITIFQKYKSYSPVKISDIPADYLLGKKQYPYMYALF